MFRTLLSLIVCLGIIAGAFYVYGNPFEKPSRFAVGDCLRMDFPGVEHWNYGMIGKVESLGKQNYGMKYWLEYGWSTYTDSWPYSVQAIKVECPVTDKGVQE